MARYTLRGNFRSIDPASARVILLEAADRVLTPYPPQLSSKAQRSLVKLGVTVRTGSAVTEVRPDAVVIRHAEGSEEIRTYTVLWGAGVQGSPLAQALAQKTGAALDRAGRIHTKADCTLPGRPEVFVLGDMTCFVHQTGNPLPGVAQVAMQMGQYAARVIRCRLDGKEPPGPFRYKDYGSMATIGASHAVADLGWVKLSGYLAWLAWLFIHLIYLIAFENRMLVLFQWAWNYFTRNRSARLITGPALPDVAELERGGSVNPELPPAK
jgi:NADH dehydrogenase